MKPKTIIFKSETELYAKVKYLAYKKETSMGQLIRDALSSYIGQEVKKNE